MALEILSISASKMVKDDLRDQTFITLSTYHNYIPGWTKKTEGDIIRIITKVDSNIVVQAEL